jgi:hypothetical protein
MTILKNQILEKLPDITIGTDSKAKDKGWNSPQMVDKWLKENCTKEELFSLPPAWGWAEGGVEKTKSGIYSFW